MMSLRLVCYRWCVYFPSQCCEDTPAFAGTFHSVAMRMLRVHVHRLPHCGRDRNFNIHDQEDNVNLLMTWVRKRRDNRAGVAVATAVCKFCPCTSPVWLVALYYLLRKSLKPRKSNNIAAAAILLSTVQTIENETKYPPSLAERDLLITFS